MYSNSQVMITIVGAFIAGFSSIFTGINFIVTIHKMRAPGMTWFRIAVVTFGATMRPASSSSSELQS